MDIQNIIRKHRRGRKTVLITIRVTPEISDWLRNKDYSPTGIFYEAIKQLGFRNNNEKEYQEYNQKRRRNK